MPIEEGGRITRSKHMQFRSDYSDMSPVDSDSISPKCEQNICISGLVSHLLTNWLRWVKIDQLFHYHIIYLPLQTSRWNEESGIEESKYITKNHAWWEESTTRTWNGKLPLKSRRDRSTWALSLLKKRLLIYTIGKLLLLHQILECSLALLVLWF